MLACWQASLSARLRPAAENLAEQTQQLTTSAEKLATEKQTPVEGGTQAAAAEAHRATMTAMDQVRQIAQETAMTVQETAMTVQETAKDAQEQFPKIVKDATEAMAAEMETVKTRVAVEGEKMRSDAKSLQTHPNEYIEAANAQVKAAKDQKVDASVLQGQIEAIKTTRTLQEQTIQSFIDKIGSTWVGDAWDQLANLQEQFAANIENMKKVPAELEEAMAAAEKQRGQIKSEVGALRAQLSEAIETVNKNAEGFAGPSRPEEAGRADRNDSNAARADHPKLYY